MTSQWRVSFVLGNCGDAFSENVVTRADEHGAVSANQLLEHRSISSNINIISDSLRINVDQIIRVRC